MEMQPGNQSGHAPGNGGNILNVGIIGCGRIAEYHLRFIEKTAGARVTALSDPVLANAKHYAERYKVGEIYASHVEMLKSSLLDVVHILTPPEFHYGQAVDAIDRGMHVFLEKPCTIHSHELEDLYQRAQAKNVVLCPDFIQLYHPTFLQGASLIDSGRLGKVVHIEVHLSVDLDTPDLRQSIGLPWRFNLPGGILHDNLTHPLYMALRWLGAPEKVTVFPQSHGVLPEGLTDHLSIMLKGKSSTANIVLSALIKPEPYYIQIFCERGNLLVNFDTSASLVTSETILPRFLRRATANFQQAWQLSGAGVRNLILFARGRLVPYQGLENLIPRFYDCLRKGGEAPVPKQLAIAVARTEEEIFAQAGKLHLRVKNRPSTQKLITRAEKILVTGATGYLGSVVVRKLVEEGYYVRALVRELSRTERLEELAVELIYGDIRKADCLIDACKGIDVVIHMAAALNGASEVMLDCAVNGTKNVALAAERGNVKRVIYVSSMSVYDCLKLHDGEVISENSPLEEQPQFRGAYSLAKRRAEDEALAHLRDEQTQWTILRPSVIVGENHDVFSPLGKKLGKFLLCPGSGKKMLRLIHIDDVASAVIKVIQNDGTGRRIFNLSAEEVSQQEYIDRFIRKIGYDNLRVIYIPLWMARFAAGALGILRLLSRKIPNINRRRLASLYRTTAVNSDAIKSKTGWEPRKNLLQSLVDDAQSSQKVPAGQSVETMTRLA